MDSSLQKAKQIFINFLKDKNLNVTESREQVLQAVFSTHDHFDAEELLFLFKKQKIAVSRATIYRTLDLLVECQLVKKLSLGDSCSRYEHVFGHEHHDHLICTQCGKIIEFYNDQIEALQRKICDENDFIEVEHSLRIFGLCKDCQ